MRPQAMRAKLFFDGRLEELAVFYLLFQICFCVLSCSEAWATMAGCGITLGPNDSLLIKGMGGRVYASHYPEIPRIPASTIKLLTSLAAFDFWGPSHRFKTELFTDQEGNLYVKGYGDPLLISEVLTHMAFKISQKVKNVKDIIVDDSYFDKPIQIPGRAFSSNPYDAPIGALCANFNTIFFKRDSHGRPVSAEPQTPLIPFARKKILELGLPEGRVTLSHHPDDPSRYVGELLAHFLRENNVKVRGKVRVGIRPEGLEPLLIYFSPFTLKQVIAKMLEFSNNFMANQILVSMGAGRLGPPGTISKGVRVVTDYAQRVLGLRSLRLVEGSGLSRENRISATDMIRVLQEFAPYRTILKKDGRLFYKTGTLKNISSLAGYLHIPGSRKTVLFAIFTSGYQDKLPRVKACLDSIKLDGGLGE